VWVAEYRVFTVWHFVTMDLHFMETLYNDDLRPYFHKRRRY